MSRRYPIPGLESHPDLRAQYDAAVRRNCTSCEESKLIQKFQRLVEQRRVPKTPLLPGAHRG